MRCVLLCLFMACGSSSSPVASPAEKAPTPAKDPAAAAGDQLKAFLGRAASAFDAPDCDQATVQLELLAAEAAALSAQLEAHEPPPGFKLHSDEVARLQAMGLKIDSCEKLAIDKDRLGQALDRTLLTVMPLVPSERIKAWQTTLRSEAQQP